MSLQKLTALRALMASQPTALAAYIVPTADAHNSEYIAATDARREWLSGFTGSAGTALVTADRALVWTDGRYYTQFDREVDLTLWTLMRQSLPDTPTMEAWLLKHMPSGSVVGADPHTMTREEWTPLQNALTKAKMQLVAVDNNLVDQIRRDMKDPPPPRPCNKIMHVPVQYTGKTAGKKIEELREKMREKKASALVITALDEVAYTLNLRGSDIEYNPVLFAYLVITEQAVRLFWGTDALPAAVADALAAAGVAVDARPYGDVTAALTKMALFICDTEQEVRLFRGTGALSAAVADALEAKGVAVDARPYGDVTAALTQMAKEFSESGEEHSIWLSSDASEAIHRAASGSGVLSTPLNLISEVSPVTLMKMIKNDVELEGFRKCHIRDGIAVVRLFRWLHEHVDAGDTVTEIQAADKLLEFRKEEQHFMGPSFETIAGAGENGAVIHYSPARDGVQRDIRPTDMFLLDSGGQYLDGTTDITRTRHMGTPSDAQRDAFTRVLKGQIAISTALYPQGVRGNVLDSLARKYLWDVGLDYAHGTGHGVGHFLNVHEGPSGVSWRPYPHDPGLKPHQILSNEPGYYKVGEYGIRHEDLVITVNVTKDSEHPRASGLLGDFDGRGVLGMETITLVPNQRKCMKLDLLTDFELAYINAYHARVLRTLGPELKARGLTEDLAWLQRECEVITRTYYE